MSKKVAQVITLTEMGGAQKHLYMLSKSLNEAGYEVDVISSNGGALVELLKKENINFIESPYMVREISPIVDFKNILYLYKLFKKNKYDIVHCHSSKAGLVARIAARLAGVPKIIYTAHGFVFNEPMSLKKKKIYTAIEYLGAKLGHVIIAVSNKDYKCAKELIPKKEKNIYYIPNAIKNPDMTLIKEKSEMKEALDIPADGFLVGTVSNFYETKGHSYLIKALMKLYDEGYDFYTVFAGEGPKFEESKKLCKAYSKISFLGYRTDNLDIMNAMDIFVLPSVKEGMPYVVLEAMSLGKPVLCTKVGALTDIISNEKNGFIVNPESEEELYNALKKIFNNKKILNDIGKKGKEFINKNYSYESFIKSILDIYNK